MIILSETHKDIIIRLNRLTNNQVSIGGSMEDYMLLGYAEKTIGDIDFKVNDDETFQRIKNEFDLPPPKPSYYNRLHDFERRDKYTITIDGVVVDFLVLVVSGEYNFKYEYTEFEGILIRHLEMWCKIKLIKEWISNSIPNDMWAYEKFVKILGKYENINHK